jgi:hypothetical protein
MECVNCGENNPEKVSMTLHAVKGYCEKRSLCMPCWWLEVEARLMRKNGRTIREEKKIRGNRKGIIGQAGAFLFPEKYFPKRVHIQGDREGDSAI